MKKFILLIFLTGALGTVSADVPPPPCAANISSCPGGAAIAGARLVPMLFNGIWSWWVSKFR